MNRTIKFRAWDKEDKKMYRVRGFTFYNIDAQALYSVQVEDVDGEELSEYPSNAVGKLELTQFTGLLDKNGKEIYEKDILKIDNYMENEVDIEKIGVVKYSLYGQRGFCLFDNGEDTEESCYPRHHLDSLDVTMGKSDYSRHWEVIGNIYENPELLTKN